MNLNPLGKRNASYSSCYDVWKYISELGISKVKYSPRITASKRKRYFFCNVIIMEERLHVKYIELCVVVFSFCIIKLIN